METPLPAQPRAAADPLQRARTGIATMFFALGFGYANWLSRIPSVRETLALGDGELGLLLLFGGTGSLCSFRLASRVLKRLPSRSVAGGSSALFGLFLCLPAATLSPLLAAAALWAAGFCNGLMDVALNAQALTVERRVGRPLLAALHGFFSLGGFLGAAAGAVAASLDIGPAPHLATIGVLLAGVSWWAGTVMLADEAQSPSEAAPPKRRGMPLTLVVLGGIAFCSAVGEGAMAEWTAVYLRDGLHTSMGLAGLGYALFSAAMVFGRLRGERYVRHLPPAKLLVGCGLVAALSLACGLLGNTPLWFTVGVFGCGMGLSLVIPLVLRLAVEVPQVDATKALSDIATLGYGGFLFGPPVIGLWSQHSGLRLALCTVIVLCVSLSALARTLPTQR